MQGPVGTLRSLCIAAIVFLSWAGIAGAEVVDHAFGFDMRYDDQTSEVLDYRYGDSKSPVSATREAVRDGKVFLSANVNGPMSRGDFLYVKWRDRSSGEVGEDTVDLRSRLPADLAGSRIHFVIRDGRLLVYLISPRPRPPQLPASGPELYRHRSTTVIYPDAVRQ
jgi:hypothetical protein